MRFWDFRLLPVEGNMNGQQFLLMAESFILWKWQRFSAPRPSDLADSLYFLCSFEIFGFSTQQATESSF